jgi:molybdopterin/thiamine biosynthesis adenylyltransferase
MPEDTVYEHLKAQLPRVLSAGNATNRNDVARLEVAQAEPRSAYYEYQHPSAYLIDGAWSLKHDGDRGLAVLGFRPGTQPEKALEKGIPGAVLEIQDSAGKTSHVASEAINNIYRGATLKVRWVKLPAPPNIGSSGELLKFINKELPQESKYITSKANKNGVGVIGFVFPEQGGWRTNDGEGWLFLTFCGRKRRNSPARITHYLSKAERSGLADLIERIPELRPLGDKTIAVIGCGCVGAPSVLEFAKAGVGELRLWDRDIVQAGNLCRWPLGLPVVGYSKVEALAQFIQVSYPQTKINRDGLSAITIGKPGSREPLLLQEFLRDVDLVFDATAERGIQLYLSAIAKEKGLPYVLAESRPGGWGGLVARFLPKGDQGCYYCMLHSLDDGSLPSPPAKSEDFVQPQGCISPTFTASSFDTSTVSLAAVRLAISSLTGNIETGYPFLQHDIGILALRDVASGQAIFPQWNSFPLKKHLRCHCNSNGCS